MVHTDTTIQKISSGVYSIDQDMVRCFLIVGETRAMLLDTGAEPYDLMSLIRSVTKLPLLVLHTLIFRHLRTPSRISDHSEISAGSEGSSASYYRRIFF